MNERRLAISTTELLATTSKILEENGYKRAEPKITSDWGMNNARVFEDNYGILLVVVYDTWQNLSAYWADAQSFLVELISDFVGSGDAKSWDGYLVLLTPNPIPKNSYLELIRLRYDTTRVRKLIGTGEEIRTMADVKNVLMPLLPLGGEIASQFHESILDLLPSLISSNGIPEEAVRTVINAFLAQRPILEDLHHYRSKK